MCGMEPRHRVETWQRPWLRAEANLSLLRHEDFAVVDDDVVYTRQAKDDATERRQWLDDKSRCREYEAGVGGRDMSLSLNQLIEALTLEIHSQKSGDLPRDIGRVSALMAAWDITHTDEWSKYALFDDDKSYTRNLVWPDKDYTLMMLCWNKGKCSMVHDHSNSECWVRVVSGSALEERFASGQDDAAPLVQTSLNTYPVGAVTHISDAIGLHRLGNAGDDAPMISLHCYSPPFGSCKVFPEKTGKGVTCTMNFYSTNGSRQTEPIVSPSTSSNAAASVSPCDCS